MSGWIKFEKDLLTDPRVLRIAKTLERRWAQFDTTDDYDGGQFDPSNAIALPAVTLVCGALARMWCLADTHIDENDVLPLGKSDLDDVIGIPGFCDLLPGDWLTVIDETHVKLPSFHEHNGTEAKKKAVTQKRVERFRKGNVTALPQRNAQALPDQDQDQDQKQSAPIVARSLPEDLNPTAWQKWEDYRKQIRKPLKPASIPAAQKALAAFGSEQESVVDHSIANGYTGLFPPGKGTQKPKGNVFEGAI